MKKNVKSPYLSNRLTDLDEIWHAGADWPSTGDISLKFQFFKKQDRGGSHLEKQHKSRYHNKILTDLREIWHDNAKIGLLSAQTVQKFEFPKSKMAERKQQPTTEGETEVLVYKMNFTFINLNARI